MRSGKPNGAQLYASCHRPLKSDTGNGKSPLNGIRVQRYEKKLRNANILGKCKKRERLDSKNDRNICIFQKLFVSLQMKFASMVHTTLQHYS
jgi:hypothetical protein